MKKVIGTITTYHGQEHRYLAEHKVRIVAVLKNALLQKSSELDLCSRVDEHAAGGAVNAARPDIDVDGPDYAHLDDDRDIARAGGVTAHDRIEVQPFIEKEGRFSFVTSDPKAVDLAAFERLPRKND
jgi:hypothetical protein